MKILERRVVMQDWYETEDGWESESGWYFKDTEDLISHNFNVRYVLEFDKYINPILAIAEKETEI